MNPAGLVLAAIGLFSFAGGLCNWHWFMNARKARALVRMIGPGAARVFYMLLGLVIAVYGVLLTVGTVGGAR